jgi:hypothetical protein
MSVSNHTDAVRITFFADYAAATKHEETLTLHDLADKIVNTSAPTKVGLPWLKLATFGDSRTAKGSLRHNENLQSCSGLEADYDAERVSFGDAVSLLREARISALVYTSPSHTEAKPRWRVLCGFSEERSPEQRDLYMARLSGLFRGIFAAESWTLSQSHFYGAVNHNPDHRAELIAGTPIDLADHLDAGARGKPEKAAPNGHERPLSSGAGSYAETSDARLEGFRRKILDTLRDEAVDGAKHTALRSAALKMGGIQAAAGFSDAEATGWLLDCLPSSVIDWAAAKETARWGLEQGRGRPLELADRPRPNGTARPHPEPPPDDTPPPAGADAEPQAKPQPGTDPPAGAAELRALLSVESWAKMDIPEPDRLLGDLITRTTRMFLVGRTGLGKTLLGLAIAAGVASGQGFLHWLSSRPARVLYIDGEMPAELIKPRAADAMRRLGVAIPVENLLIFGRDIEAEAMRICPSLPPFGPLNTDEGRLFMLALLEAVGGVDLIVFDNVMSLISGSMKDEEAWLATVPLVTMLTGKQIGQLWLDHTGHNTDRQYGTSTKAWQFDAVGQMAPLADEKPDPRATAFTLTFDYPGKARRRTPGNWTEFQARIIRLVDDQWTSEPAVDPQADPKPAPLRPGARAQYDALMDALAASPPPGRTTTRDVWYAECVRLGLADAIAAKDTPAAREKKTGTFRAYLSQLKIAGWIGVDGETVTSLKGAG